MRETFDLSNLERSTVGFERLFDLLSTDRGPEDTYPPYNIERLGEDSYRITLAVAGFRTQDLEVTAEPNLLTITGKGAPSARSTYLHQGIPLRPFARRFNLADYVVVREAELNDGLLTVTLARELPEALKPRQIAIATANSAVPQKRAA
jgi:molecular chaperone IbpA